MVNSLKSVVGRIDFPNFESFEREVFTGNGTFNTAPGSRIYYITGWGGGGGGGEGDATPGGSGGGGGASCYRVPVLLDGDDVASVTVTVGAAGVGGTDDATNGTAGTDTSFGTYLTLEGGLGGTSWDNGYVGGDGGDFIALEPESLGVTDVGGSGGSSGGGGSNGTDVAVSESLAYLSGGYSGGAGGGGGISSGTGGDGGDTSSQSSYDFLFLQATANVEYGSASVLGGANYFPQAGGGASFGAGGAGANGTGLAGVKGGGGGAGDLEGGDGGTGYLLVEWFD